VNTTEDTHLVDLLLEFLRSFKSAESVDPELRAAISVSTGLEQNIVSALNDQRVVLLTGSAGSGKTHLLQAVRNKLEETVRVLDEPKAIRDKHVVMIQDATVLSPQERIDAVSGRSANRMGTLVAINEGPLREAAAIDGGEIFSDGVDLLHAAKRGQTGIFDQSKPTIVDMAAFDPLEARVLEQLLALPLLDKVIARISPSPHSMRRRAWKMLDSVEARRRVAEIIELARLVQPEWLFRDVWDFLADLVLGGSDEGEIPTSAWFWRIFYGDSGLSAALHHVADPLMFALPMVESRICYRQWDSEHLRLADNLQIIPFSSETNTSEPDWMTWIKTQYLILGADYDLPRHVHTTGQGRLSRSVWHANVPDLLKSINEYIVFGLKEGSATRLDLWVDHRVERRIKHHEGLIRLGEAASIGFKISASRVVANHPSGEIDSLGKERFLLHIQSNTALALDRARLRTLETARSLRIADRTHADLDWDLHAFFAQALLANYSTSAIDVFKIDVAAGQCSSSRYSISLEPPTIEEG
jgi:energy-coupling factor transporter ATP-binding protein EcfA2